MTVLSNKDSLETQVRSLTDELKHVKGDKESDVELWKVNIIFVVLFSIQFSMMGLP